MNKLRYRIVFNRARGQLMAVSETARSDGKGAAGGGTGAAVSAPGLARAGQGMARLRRMTLLLAGAFGASLSAILLLANSAAAQVVADHSAPGNQQPTVLNTANGVIQVNIQAPSAAGVSRNTYSQFDVPQSGVVLNNSRTNVQSQLGGYVQGNPWLSAGSARVILNEVNSSNPSQIRGYIEVAGPRAEVIVANPAGININGGGFINVSRATLTTGTPILRGGALDGYSVQRGLINIDGTGLDAGSTDFTNLIARSVAINAGVWAQQLTVATGASQVNADATGASPGGGSGAAPKYGIDVSQLGGMYANKIILLGTEAGVGVRNAGTIGAAAGEVVVTADGRLENSGSLGANGAVRVNAGSLANSGTISSSTNAVLAIRDDASNVGGTVQADHLDFTSATGGIDNSGGKIVQTGSAALDLGAAAIVNGAGGTLGTAPAAPVTGSGGGADNGASAGTGSGGTVEGSGDTAGGNTGGTPSTPVIVPNGTLHAATTFTNNGGQVSAGGGIGLAVQSMDNSNSALYLSSLSVTGANFNNRLGKLNVQNDLTLRTTSFDNQGGSVLVGGGFDGQFNNFNNRNGVLQAGQLQLTTSDGFDNTRGVLRSTGTAPAQLSFGGQLTNEQGKIETAGDLALSAGSITGSRSALTSLGNLNLNSGVTTTANGTWIVSGNASLRSGTFDNSGGSISVGKDLAANTAALNNRAGTISASGSLALDAAGALDSRNGYLQAGSNLTLSSTGLLSNDAGVIEALAAGSAMQVRAQAIDNGSGRIVNVGTADTVIASQGRIDSAGTIAGNGKLTVGATTLQNRTGGTVSSGQQLQLGVTQQLDNLGGTITSGGALNFDQAAAGLTNSGQITAGSTVTFNAAAINNDHGTIATATASGADLLIHAASVSNKAGNLVADRNASVTVTGGVDNTAGTLQAGKDVQLVSGGTLSNEGGKIEATAATSVLDIRAAAISNGTGRIVNAGNGATTINSAGAIANAGLIAGNGNVALTAQSLSNQAGGSVASAGTLDLAVRQQIDNASGGIVSASGALTLDQAGATINNSGNMVSGGPLSLTAHQITNDGGQLATITNSGADVLLHADGLSNDHGTIVSDHDIGITMAGAVTNDAGNIQAQRDLQLTAGGALNNLSGVIEAVGAVSTFNLQAGSIASSGRIVNVGTGVTNLTSQTGVTNSGIIAGNGSLNMAAQALQNTIGGSVVAGKALALGVTQQLDNLGGTISSAGTLTFNQAQAGLTNSGQIVAGGNVAINANQVNNNGGQISTAAGSLANITLAAQALSNRGGKLVADGSGTLTSAAAFDNTQGSVHAGTNLNVTAAGAVSNDAGLIEAVGATSTFALQGQSIDNGTGRIYNVGTGASSIAAQNGISNNGAIATNGALTLQGTTLLNGVSGSIGAGNLNLLLGQQVTNQGSINSAGTLTLNQAGAALVNSGQMIAGGDMNLTAYSINNDGGSIGTGQTSGANVTLTTQQLSNAGGHLSADKDLTVSTSVLQAVGNMAAGHDLALSMGGDYTQTNASTLQANRNLSLTVGGTLTNTGTLQAVNDLTLTAGQVNNQAGAVMQGENVAINTTGTLTNAGEINSNGALAISAGAVNNTNSIVGGDLSVTAQTVNNSGTTALLGATSSLGLWVASELNNTGGATIYSAGDMAIAANQGRDAGGDLVNYTGTLNNIGSTIEATGNLALSANTINNTRENVVIDNVTTLDETTTMAMPTWWQANAGDAGGNHHKFLTTASHYHAYEVYFVDPADILEQSTLITPDGNTVTKVVLRTHANDSVFYSAWSGYEGAYGKRSRITATDGQKVLYYTGRLDNQTNPDQGGTVDGISTYSQVTDWSASDLTLSSSYGSCSTNCVRLVSDLNYTDPTHTILREQQFNLPAVDNSVPMEVTRTAHHTVTEQQLSANSGPAAQILSGGDMRIVIGQALNNNFGNLMAGGTYSTNGGATINAAEKLHRTHSFDGTHNYDNAASTAYTAASISEVIGQVSGVISGQKGVLINGISFSNIDVSAGTIGNIRSGFTVLGSGNSNHATGSANGSGVSTDAAVQGPTANQGLLGMALGHTSRSGGASRAANAGPLQAATADQGGAVAVVPNGLTKQNPDPAGSYLFETRPQFANLQNWIGSDYLLRALALDPSATQKRLGDAFYEQSLVRDQLAELTGRHIAGGAASDAAYQALLTSAVSYAKEWNLRPGIALTAAQVSQLTSDIVWLESQAVRLPDGSTQTVLVPKVYLAHVADGSVKQGGALVTGDSVVINVDNFVNRGGTIDGSNASGTGRTVLIATNDLINQGGTIKGNNVALQAGNDLVNQTLTAKQSYTTKDNTGSYTAVFNQATITATNTLSATAGRDVSDVGGVISAGGAASIAAGRDVSFTTAQTGSTFEQVKGKTSLIDSTVNHQVSQVNTGTDLTVSAGRDLTLNGTQATIGTSGVGDGTLLAGRTLTVAAVTNESKSDHHSDAASKTYSKDIHKNQTVVGSSVGASDSLTLAAGLSETGSLNVTASNLAAGGALGLAASGDVNIASASESHLSDTASKSSSSGFLKKSSTSKADYSASTQAMGSSLSGDTVAIKAGNDINIAASQITAKDTLQLNAGRDLTVTTATATNSDSHFLETKKSGVTIDMTHGVGYLSEAGKTDQRSDSTTQVGSVLSGGSVTAVSGRDTLIQGSTVVADNDVALLAARNLSIVSALDTTSEGSLSSSKKSGMIGTFGQPAVGTTKSSEDGTSNTIKQVGSQVASLGGDVTLRAGEKYTQTSSQVLAPKGDIDIAAKDVLIDAAADSGTSSQHSAMSKVAIGGTANVPVIESVKGMASLAKSAKDTSNGRMQGLAAVTAAMQAKDALNGVANVANTAKNGAGIKVSVSLGSSKSESTTVQTYSNAIGSQINAGGNVSIAATGGGKDSNLTAIGSDITGGGDVSLKADNAINLLAAENTASQHSNNSSSSSSIGIGYAFGGTQNGFTLDIAASKARGNADGDDVGYSNTHVKAGGTTSLQSGGDTNIKGGVVSGNKVVADVGGNLNIESLQDKSTFDSKQQSAGFSLSICYPPFCYGASTASVSVSSAKVKGDFLSVSEQSGIKAGDGGYQVKVAGNTDLIGGVVSSSQLAVDQKLNGLSTGSLTYSNLVNKDVYDASGFAMSATVSASIGEQSKASQKTKDKLKDAGPARPGGTGGVGSASGSQGSVTQSGISGGALTITDAAKQAATGKEADVALAGIARDVTTENSTDKAGTLSKAWNGQDLMKEVQAQTAITQAFSAQAPKAIASFSASKAEELRDQKAKYAEGSPERQTLEQEAKKWDEGGVYRTALHAASGALMGGVGGALGSGAVSTMAGELDKMQGYARLALQDIGMSAEAARGISQGLAEFAALGIGGIAGGTAGAGAALAVDTNNRQLHPAEIDWIVKNSANFAKALSEKLERPVSSQEAMTWLTAAGEADVDNDYQRRTANNLGASTSEESRAFFAAKQFIVVAAKGTFVDQSNASQTLFKAKGKDFYDSAVYAGYRNDASYRDFMWETAGDNLKPDNPTVRELEIYADREKQRLLASAKGAAISGGIAFLGITGGKFLNRTSGTSVKGGVAANGDKQISPIDTVIVSEESVDSQSVWHATKSPNDAAGILDKGIQARYLNPDSRFGVAFYVAEQPATSLAEMAHYGVDPTTGIRFEIDSTKMRVLDLTNKETAAVWGYSGGEISGNTKKIGSIAKMEGYNAIRFNSERAPSGVNIAVISKFNDILKPVMATPAKP